MKFNFKYIFILIVGLGLMSLKTKPVHIFMAGDSTMSNKLFYKNYVDPLTGEITPQKFRERGWGMALPGYFNDNVLITNYAKNGRSTRTFIEEGWWAKIMKNLQKGDYVIIEFGHNDEVKTKKSYTDPAHFRANLERFVEDVKSKGGHPILCTSIARRKFVDGKLVHTHGNYPQIVRDVAKEKNVPMVDMEKYTFDWLSKEGVAKSRMFFHKLAPGISKLYPNGLDDNTHLNSKGAHIVAGFFVDGLKQLKIKELVQNLKENEKPYVSKVWVSDLGNGKYKNPVIYADYSDPDVCRVGDDYYLVASSFANIPGLPILHSKDLVNWTIVGHAINQMVPLNRFNTMQHGNGVWAPSIRYHNNKFYIYFGDPDAGIYMTEAKNITGPWSPLTLVKAGKGLIDACPLWDDNGRAYVVHAYAGSRAGMKSVLAIFEMTPDGKKAITGDRLVFDGHPDNSTCEGPKFYKRDGYYYIFCPAGGVKPGWQLAMRSKNIYGPYHAKVVIKQGNTDINGPHQGAWVETPDGKQSWFIHFQDLYAYGRAVLLEPMKWVNGWPVIGEDKNGDGCGNPVSSYTKPDVGKVYPICSPVESDEFNKNTLGLQWQWQGNSNPLWYYPHGDKGYMRLFAWEEIGKAQNLWDDPALLLQKFPAPDFKATTKLTFYPYKNGERAGLIIMGQSYAAVTIDKTAKGMVINNVVCEKAVKGNPETVQASVPALSGTVYFRVEVKQTRAWNSDHIYEPTAHCQFSYSLDGKKFTKIGGNFVAAPGQWIGAKVGIFCQRPKHLNDSGYADFDWFRVGK